MKKSKKADEDDGCGCFVILLGIALVILATLHGCAAIISAF